jgi:hypothetical protein
LASSDSSSRIVILIAIIVISSKSTLCSDCQSSGQSEPGAHGDGLEFSVFTAAAWQTYVPCGDNMASSESKSGSRFKKRSNCQAWWLTPAISSSWDAEIRRIMV